MWTGLLLVWTLSEIIIFLSTRTSRKEGNVQDRGSLVILWIAIVSSMTACGFLRYSDVGAMFEQRHGIRTISLIFILAGLAIRWAAILSLGKSFSANVAIHAEQTVHRTGLYRFVRHPSYLGLLFIFFAVGLHSNNWIGLAIALIPPTAALLYRIRVEEAALVNAFGNDYLTYSQVTKRLIPGIY